MSTKMIFPFSISLIVLFSLLIIRTGIGPDASQGLGGTRHDNALIAFAAKKVPEASLQYPR